MIIINSAFIKSGYYEQLWKQLKPILIDNNIIIMKSIKTGSHR